MTLYNKYRPKTFGELVQSKFNKNLGQSFSHHAYMFFGPPGTGKTSAARLCMAELSGTEEGSPERETYISGEHPDYHEVNCAINNGVDDIRNLVSDVVHTMPMQAKYKFVIFDEAHMLTTQAQNALLKTVEEPPKRVKFVFCTTEIHKVLPAIRSRCQIVPFIRLNDRAIEQILDRVCKGEGYEVHPESLEIIVGSSDGSARNAINILEQCSGALDNPETVAQIVGTTSHRNFYTLTKHICEKNNLRTIELFDEIVSNAIDSGSIMNKYADYLADLIVKRLQDPKKCEFEGKQLLIIASNVNNILKDFKILQNVKLIGKIYLLKAISQL